MKQEDDENISTTPKALDTLKKDESGKRDNMSWLHDEAKPTRTCSAVDRKSAVTVDEDWDRPKSEITKGSHTVIPVSSRNTPLQNTTAESPDELWRAVEKSRSENKFRKDYSGIPLIPIQLPGNELGRTQSREGLLISPPVSRYQGSIISVAGDDSNSDGSGPEFRASSVMSVTSMSHKGPVPTPRPTSSRKLFFLNARPTSTQNPEMPSPASSDSSSYHKPLVDGSALDDTYGRTSTSTQADDIETPTFAEHPESPRVSRQRYRLEQTVSNLISEEIETDL